MSITLNLLKNQRKLNKLFFWLSNIEQNFFDIDKIKISDPVFVCGMARSGTTFLTHLIDASDKFSAFRYKNLPFYTIPIFWNYFNSLFYFNKKNLNRIHGDNLKVGVNSPDAFEEIIWKNNLDEYSQKGYWQDVKNNNSKKLIDNLEIFIKKIIFLNNNNRYLSKNNNNIFRVKYLLDKFPTSKIILVIRNPLDVAISSARVHFKFLNLHKKNKNFSEELAELGHFEFGYNRKLFNFGENKYNKNINLKFKTIKFYLKKYLELLNYIENNYMKEINEKKFIVFNYDNMKNFENLSSLFDLLKIEKNTKANFFFNDNFSIAKKQRLNIEKIKIDLKVFNRIKEYSIN